MELPLARASLPRYAPLNAWCNRLLRVDLSTNRIWATPTEQYLPDYIGGRGLATKLLWDEFPEPVAPFDPRAPIMIIPGALTGTRSPYSGRTIICAFSPQADPYPWFTRASIGLDWGAELKQAGYDGVVITGASTGPVQILIRDDEVSIQSADNLWGLDSVDAQTAAAAQHGEDIKTMTIGPAGENLAVLATVSTGTKSVAGQGGFGAVFGSKKLKAISVAGTGRVRVADPERLNHLYQLVAEEMRTPNGADTYIESLNTRLQQEGGGKARRWACTKNCPSPCGLYLQDVPGRGMKRNWSGAIFCVGNTFKGNKDISWLYNWDLGVAGGFEVASYANHLGLNHWDLLVAIIPWLRMCEQEGLVSQFNGRPLAWNSSEFWVNFLHDIAYGIGEGQALAQGGWRAARELHLGEEIIRRCYSGWGYSGHWDGHAAFVNYIVYPFWITSALHWAMDTRDPASSTHDYIQNVMFKGPFAGKTDNPNAHITWDHMMAIGQRLYGRADTFDPRSGYEGKALPAAYHAVRSLMKDSLPVDDQRFPLIFSNKSADRFVKLDGIDGPDMEVHLFRAGTGIDWTPADFTRAAERAYNLDRAIAVRHWGRDRSLDESVLPSFEYLENWENPATHERHALDRKQFLPLMDEYYRLCGWDQATGWPTCGRLAELGLADVYDPMVAGARAARARLPHLEPVPPVIDWHTANSERQLAQEKEAVK
ncbi:MAG: aldehyde ferredoxin oxidoreductase N-terminal domain-containing protein [Anaerolineae bacterium]